MFRFLIIIYLLIPSAAIRSENPHGITYHYAGKPLNLQPRSFRVYVLPKLKTIMQKYYNLLESLNSDEKPIIKIKKSVDDAFLAREIMRQTCMEGNESKVACKKEYQNLYKSIRKIDENILTTKKEMDLSKKRNIKSSIDYIINVTANLNECANLSYQLLHKMELNFLRNKVQDTKELDPLLNTLRLSTEEMLAAHLSPYAKEVFDFAWANFFRNINNHIIFRKDSAYLLRHLEELNIAWNTFSVKFTRGPGKLPKNKISIVKSMHLHWNAVLKVVLNS